jgi:uncharacterized protein (DUF1778 family)
MPLTPKSKNLALHQAHRATRIGFVVSNSEHEIICAAANSAGYNLSGFIRSAALKEARHHLTAKQREWLTAQGRARDFQAAALPGTDPLEAIFKAHGWPIEGPTNPPAPPAPPSPSPSPPPPTPTPAARRILR